MITGRLGETMEMMKTWNLETLKAYKYIMFVAIAIALVGVYWFLGWTKLGLALIFVLILCLAGILALERRLYQKMDEENLLIPEEIKEEKQEDKKEEKQEEEEGFGLGLPTAESCKKALEDF